jgi:glycosyltransferase involved in cell wall biosynthesis
VGGEYLAPTLKVTIGISFRNPGKHFELALKSVFSQTFNDWELILVDDGSSDDSLALARSIKDPRVRVYSDGLTKRSNVRMNELVRLARAPYFFIMDADDIMHPERVQRQYAELVRHASDTVIGTGAWSIDGDSKIVGTRHPIGKLSGFGVHQSFINPSVAAATEWFRRNPDSESFIFHRAQDAELWCRTASHSNFVNLPELLLYYREVGVFSYENYLGSQLGLIYLLRTRFCRPRMRYVAALLKCLAKIFLVSVCDGFGKADLVVARRFEPLSPEQRRHAEDGLARVLSCPLPI